MKECDNYNYVLDGSHVRYEWVRVDEPNFVAFLATECDDGTMPETLYLYSSTQDEAKKEAMAMLNSLTVRCHCAGEDVVAVRCEKEYVYYGFTAP